MSGVSVRNFKTEYRISWVKLVLLLALGLRIGGFVGLVGSDDMGYIIHARELALGTFQLSADHFSNRWGMLLPESLLFCLFGPRIGFLALYPLALGLIEVYLAFRLGRLAFGPQAGALAALLTATLPIHVAHSTAIYSDLPAAVFLTLSFFLMLVSAEQDQGRQIRALFLSGLALGWSYLCRETAVLLFPAYLLFFLGDLRGRRRAAWSGAAFGLGAALLPGLEMGAYYFLTGDPWLHYTGAQSALNFSPLWTTRATIDQGLLWRRLSLDLADCLLTRFREFGALFVLAAGATTWALTGKNRPARRIAAWLWLFLLSFNFSSTSLAEYLPMLVTPRYLAPAFAPAAVLAGGFLHALWQSGKNRELCRPVRLGVWALVLAAGLAFLDRPGRFSAVTCLGALLILGAQIRIHRPGRVWPGWVWAAFPLAALQAGWVLFTLLTPPPIKSFPRLDAQVLEITKQHPGWPIYADPRSISIMQFLDQYRSSDRFHDFYGLTPDRLQPGYLWRQDHEIEILRLAHKKTPPAFVQTAPDSWPRLLEKSYSNEHYVLYQIP
jgi:4-amino-4-deoxy-L-arabinose transferase-like glycosyltransferase